MYARLSSVLFPIAVLMLVGSLLWGYQEHQEKNAILIKAENQYQRAFHDLTNHLGKLHDELGQSLAVSATSQGMQRKSLVNVWRLTSEAQNEINQLPLALLPFNKAEQFLSRISDFAYRTAVRDLTKQPLTKEETKTMKSLYAKAADINREMDKIRDAVLTDRLRWMDVEVAMASKNDPHDNTIIDGFRAVDKKIASYPENDWGPSSQSPNRKRTLEALSGKPDATEEQIRQKALSFVGPSLHAEAGHEVTVSANGKGTDMQTYTVTIKNRNGGNVQLDFTRKGGELLWMMNTRPVKERKLNFAQARTKAAEYLDRHGYGKMTPVTYDEYDHVAVFTFVREQNGVRIYPDKVTVRVALDNGEAVGLQASDHVFAAKTLSAGKPKLKMEEARHVLNPDFEVQDHHLAVIENEEEKQVLCHEFTGRINGNRYRIYINANTGLEEEVEKIPDSAKAILR